jgi:hypothetical protein
MNGSMSSSVSANNEVSTVGVVGFLHYFFQRQA